MLFKQTAAAFALFPIAFVLMWRRPLTLRDLLVSAIPAISILLTLAVIRSIAPGMFHAIVTVPGSITATLTFDGVPGASHGITTNGGAAYLAAILSPFALVPAALAALALLALRRSDAHVAASLRGAA